MDINEIAEIIGGETEFIGDRLEPYETLANNTKAKELLGWEPKIGRAEGLRITYDYFKSLPAEDLYKKEHNNFKEYIKK